jgi:RNA recognition motif-containing protein
MKIYVGNLAFAATSEDLETLFAQAGAVTSATVVTDKFSGRSRGFGFVEMNDDQEAQAAISQFNGKDFQGRPLTVNKAQPPAERSGGGRSGGGGRSSYGGGGGGGGRDRW